VSTDDLHANRELGQSYVPPAVSIILPTYNRKRWLEVAVASVLAQSFTDWELIVADDGSDDETRAYLRELDSAAAIRVRCLPRSGNPSKVRNAALRDARGKYVAFIDSDDVWSAGKLDAQLAALRSNPRCRWSYTSCNRIDADGRLLVPALQPATAVHSGSIFEALLAHEAWAAMPTVVAERALVDEIGGFDEDQLYGEFHDLCLRLALHSDVIALPDVLCSVRSHDEHYSANRVAALAAWVRLYDKFAVSAPTARARSCGARMRRRAALDLAGRQGTEHDVRAVWRTLRDGKVLSWRFPQLWYRGALALLRPFVPRTTRATHERTRLEGRMQ
jgi:GT2 family glycosyltransferase